MEEFTKIASAGISIENTEKNYDAIVKHIKQNFFIQYAKLTRHPDHMAYNRMIEEFHSKIARIPHMSSMILNEWQYQWNAAIRFYDKIKHETGFDKTIYQFLNIGKKINFDNLYATKSLKDLNFGGVYFLYQGETNEDGLTKIGMSNANIGNRIQSMKTGFAHKKIRGFCIKCNEYCPIDAYEEYWQGKFQSRWSHNEWYHINYAQLLLILIFQSINRYPETYYHFDIVSDAN